VGLIVADMSPLVGVDERWVATVSKAGWIRATLAENVRRERERAGLSQEALADACMVRRGTIARIEKAEREPRISTLVACSVALEVPLHVFLRGLPGEAASTEIVMPTHAA
jgi:transcriptional regulator with XRE-family HTH domain